MANWQGKSRGTVLGLKIYVFLINTFGLYFSYFVLLFVAGYFIFFSWSSTRSSFYLYRERLNYSILKAAFGVYKSYFTFGKIQLDRIAIASGQRRKYTFEFDGIQHIKDLLQQNKGGILLTAHIGNFNLAKHFFDDENNPAVVNLVMTDFEHQQIKNYLESVTGKASVNTIVLKDDLSHIFQMSEALKNNELLVFAPDRYVRSSKTFFMDFLGKEARFPLGPFQLATRNKIPVLFVHIMRDKNFHYHFYARPAAGTESSGKELLKLYLHNLEAMVRKYPHQWYNYYDFWNDLPKKAKNGR